MCLTSLALDQYTVKPVLNDHIQQDIFLAFQTGGCLVVQFHACFITTNRPQIRFTRLFLGATRIEQGYKDNGVGIKKLHIRVYIRFKTDRSK